MRTASIRELMILRLVTLPMYIAPNEFRRYLARLFCTVDKFELRPPVLFATISVNFSVKHRDIS